MFRGYIKIIKASERALKVKLERKITINCVGSIEQKEMKIFQFMRTKVRD